MAQLAGSNQRIQDLVTKVDRGGTTYVIADLPERLPNLLLATQYLQGLWLERREGHKM
jgi:hypothetical protein